MAKKNWLKEMEEDGLIRIDYMIPLMAQYPSSIMKDTAEYLSKKKVLEFCGKGVYIEELIDEEDSQGICEYILEKHFGKYLAYVSTPIKNNNLFCWGYVYNNIFLGTDIEDIIEQAFKWRAGIEKRDAAAAKKKKK